MRRRTENNELIPAVLAALAHMPEVFAFPVRLGVRGKLRVKVVPRGTPDILGLWRGGCQQLSAFGSVLCGGSIGRGLAIETKASHSDSCKCDSCAAQRAFRIDWESRGGLYLKIRSVEQVVQAIRGKAAEVRIAGGRGASG